MSRPGGAAPALAFDYEASATIQGRGDITSRQRDLAGLRLARCMAQLPTDARRLLLVGCGAGRHTRAIRRERPDLSVHGSDLSATAIHEAISYRDGAHYQVADALDLAYRDATFDVVIIFDLLEHVPDVDRAVGEVARVLRLGGLLHAFVPCENQPGTLFALFRRGPVPIHRWKRDHVGHIQQLTVAQVEAYLQRHGLQPVHQDYSFHYLGQLHDILDYWRRETQRHGRPTVAGRLALLLTRLSMPFTWRLAYLEAVLLRRWSVATGLHVTARRS